MNTLKELKELKKIDVTKIVTSQDYETQKQQFIKNMQPEEYCSDYFRKNDFNILIINDKLDIHCDIFYKYILANNCALNEIENEFKKNLKSENMDFTSVTCKKCEKINRILVTITNLHYIRPLQAVTSYHEHGLIEFRPCGDYVYYNSDDNKSHGEKIKKEHLLYDDNFNIKGFEIKTWRNETIQYLF